MQQDGSLTCKQLEAVVPVVSISVPDGDRLVIKLSLLFPYDWPNLGGMLDDALIVNVLKRGMFGNICKICAYYGIGTVDNLAAVAFKDDPSLIYS